MDMTSLARWFRLQWAITPLFQRMLCDFSAFQAQEGLPTGSLLSLHLHFHLGGMLCFAIYTDKVEKEFHIFLLGFGELVHVCRIAEKPMLGYDTGQKKTISASLCFSRTDMLLIADNESDNP